MNQDALERLRNRAKPTVQSRDLSTIPSDRDSAIAIDIQDSGNQDVEISTTIDANTISSSKAPAFKEFLDSSMEFKTKQSTIRLEQELSKKISQKCQSFDISREVLIEALFVHFENHKSIQSKVLQEARKRDKQRQKIANYRRAKSMIERFGGE